MGQFIMMARKLFKVHNRHRGSRKAACLTPPSIRVPRWAVRGVEFHVIRGDPSSSKYLIVSTILI